MRSNVEPTRYITAAADEKNVDSGAIYKGESTLAATERAHSVSLLLASPHFSLSPSLPLFLSRPYLRARLWSFIKQRTRDVALNLLSPSLASARRRTRRDAGHPGRSIDRSTCSRDGIQRGAAEEDFCASDSVTTDYGRPPSVSSRVESYSFILPVESNVGENGNPEIQVFPSILAGHRGICTRDFAREIHRETDVRKRRNA